MLSKHIYIDALIELLCIRHPHYLAYSLALLQTIVHPYIHIEILQS